MAATNFDLIVGKRIIAFDLPKFFQRDSNINALAIGSKGLSIENITWTILEINPDSITYKLGLEKAISSPTSHSFGNSYLSLKIKIGNLVEKGNEDWYEIFEHLDKNLDVSLRVNIIEGLQKFVDKTKILFYDIFFRTDTDDDFKFAASATDSHVYFVPNVVNVNESYLCVGEMIDNRQKPINATAPTALLNNSPELAFYLSPYFYLNRGVAINYQQQSKAFSEENKELTIEYVPIDRAEIAHKLDVATSDILQAHLRYITFKLEGTRFVVEYEAFIHVKNAFHVMHIPIPLTQNNYHINIHSEMYYEIFIKDGVLDAKEIENLRIYNWEKSADDPMTAAVEQLIDDACKKFTDIFIRLILPLAIDLFFGLNPIAAVILFSICDVLADKLSEKIKEVETKALINEIKNMKSLAMHFERILPFKMSKQLVITDMIVTSGVQIAGRLLHADRQFLLKGDTMIPGERVIAYNGTQLLFLEFQTDGNLVIYEEKQYTDGTKYKEDRWCSDRDRGYYTWKQGGNLVVFEDSGQLVMYNDKKKVLWRSSEETTNCNYLCVILSAAIIAQLSDEDLEGVKNGNRQITYLTPAHTPYPRVPYYVVSKSNNRKLN